MPKASGFLSSAEEQMKASKVELAKPAPAVAQPKQSDALKELYSARREIEKKINALQEQLGEESEDSGSLEDVADAIREAQKETNEALSQLQKGAPNAMQTLLEKQNQIATDLEQPILAAPSTVISRREAGAAASKLRQSDLKSAVAAMKEALKSMNEGVLADHPKALEGTPNLPAIESHQKEVLALANQLMSAMENLSKASMQKASDALGRAGKKIRPMSSGKRGGLPQAAQKELESAQENLDSGEAEAGAQQGGPAQSSAQKASQHLAQAQAAIALAQSGLGSDNQQQASNSQGQGKKPGQGQTRRSKESQPGPSGDGREGNWRGQGGADGPTQNVTGSSRFTGLPARDRAAIQQSQSEAYPQEYAPLIEQYLRNLSDQSEPK
ncbi:MAG: hypothetical protein FJ405_10550 [Verrucomicrobia bacterium]|nr:hypothetical protein [Verrucomicrobiota bacterium]